MSGAESIKIALVDNHHLMRQCLKDYLLQSGFLIALQATSGRNLINQLTKENIPDVCLIEMNFREKTEYNTIQYLNANWPDVKIVVYSLQPQPGIIEKTIPGADVVLTKHTSLADLKEAVTHLVRQKTILAE